MTRRSLVLVASLVLLGGCGYFNALYNANRRFADAERARQRGDQVTAAREYREAIERAAVSYRKYPNGRWADDALLLLGRARFSLGEHEAAAAAMRALLGQSTDRSMRASAHAYLGAALVEQSRHDTAIIHLDSAAADLPAGSDAVAFVRLWRGRAAFHEGRTEAGWADLEAAGRSAATSREAALEGIRRAAAARDSARTFEFMRRLAATPPAGRTHMQLDSILRHIADTWSPAVALHASAPLAVSHWPVAARDAIALTRAEIAIPAGELDLGLELATNLGQAVSGGVGSRARRVAARIRLGRTESVDELEDVRGFLLPAYDDPLALRLMRDIRAAQILIRAGQDPASLLSLFAAAEMLRDVVDAPLLARRLFLDFAARQPDNVWAGKAALAAHQIRADDESAAALERLAANPYVRAARGSGYVAAEIDRAEERLAYGIAGLRVDALAEAVRGDVVVGRALTVLDSTRAAARSDSVRIVCGALVDSLRIAGVRADSTRTACLRGDSARVAFVLTADTILLLDAAARVDSLGRVVRDTTKH